MAPTPHEQQPPHLYSGYPIFKALKTPFTLKSIFPFLILKLLSVRK